MTEDDVDLEHLVLVKLMRLNATITGLVSGLLLGLLIFVVTVVLVIKGGEIVGPHLGLLGQIFIGYDVTLGGSFVGLGYGVVTGFVVAYVFARVYNWLAEVRERRRSGG